ncbi:hypothetical protein CEXT_47321 [Caerostris extrusa]|uniref:Uncharacterized protein n=1 Tax=Caerostris extrusa TaxID=172846 RepID=A0AAV4MPS3_CAEEX|nr:hypothetical protein CEXT_47321 [Caerostris extrusa]
MTVEISRKGRNSSMTEDSYSSQELLHDSRKVGNSLLHVEQSILAALCPDKWEKLEKFQQDRPFVDTKRLYESQMPTNLCISECGG